MERVTSRDGTVVSYEREGEGPPLVLVHGSFSDHLTNWTYVRPLLRDRFTLIAVARRGRGETPATEGHALEAEAADVAAVIEAVGEPVFLLGHSYGALCALGAATLVPDRVAKLVLYEPARPGIVPLDAIPRMEALAAREDWAGIATTFLTDCLLMPRHEVDALARTPDWATWIADAKASLCDVRALAGYAFDPERHRGLAIPTMLLVGSESRPELYLTDTLTRLLSDAQLVRLEGQAHEGMTTAPELFAETVARFLGREPPDQRSGARRSTNTTSRRSV